MWTICLQCVLPMTCALLQSCLEQLLLMRPIYMTGPGHKNTLFEDKTVVEALLGYMGNKKLKMHAL